MKEFLKIINSIDYRDLNKNAIKLFENSDQGGLYSHFNGCKNINDINNTANELFKLYPDLFN